MQWNPQNVIMVYKSIIPRLCYISYRFQKISNNRKNVQSAYGRVPPFQGEFDSFCWNITILDETKWMK